MNGISTTRMSSKGQVVIPEAIRKSLGLETGTQFIVVGAAEDGVVILKTVSPPARREFDSLIKEARRQAKACGMKRSDISKAVKEARGRK